MLACMHCRQDRLFLNILPVATEWRTARASQAALRWNLRFPKLHFAAVLTRCVENTTFGRLQKFCKTVFMLEALRVMHDDGRQLFQGIVFFIWSPYSTRSLISWIRNNSKCFFSFYFYFLEIAQLDQGPCIHVRRHGLPARCHRKKRTNAGRKRHKKKRQRKKNVLWRRFWSEQILRRLFFLFSFFWLHRRWLAGISVCGVKGQILRLVKTATLPCVFTVTGWNRTKDINDLMRSMLARGLASSSTQTIWNERRYSNSAIYSVYLYFL